MLLHIGFGSYVNIEEIKMIRDDFTTGVIAKILFQHKLKEDGLVYDLTSGHKKECVVLLKNNACIYSGLPKSVIVKRYLELKEKINKSIDDEVLSVGHDNYVMINNILLVSGNTTARPLVTMMKKAKETNDFIDFTSGHKMRSILFMRDGTIIATNLDERTLAKRLLDNLDIS